MKVLLIDDDAKVSAKLISVLGGSHEVILAENRDDAIALVASDAHFDLAVCDLRMPSAANRNELSAEYGKEVFADLAVRRAGMPVWVFSGFADDDFSEALIRDPRSGDPFGERDTRPLVEKFRKIHLAKLVEQLRDVAKALHKLEAIEISTYGEQLNLSSEQERLVRLAARQHGATLVRVRQLAGGLSGARTLALDGMDIPGGGNHVVNCVIKIDTIDAIKKEEKRYLEGVPSILPAAVFAPQFHKIYAGAGNYAALLYSFAARDPVTLAAALSDSSWDVAAIVDRLQNQLTPWSSGGSVATISLDEFNQLLGAPTIQEAVLQGWLPAPFLSGPVPGPVQICACTQHGDLHALNVLVDDEGRPVLIDFARTTRRVASYDAVTLEFSLLFHPELAEICGDWPTNQQLGNWDNLRTYLDGCPVAEFILRCREWGHGVGLGDREYNASVLAYALRQFQFPGSHQRARYVAQRAATLLT